MSTPPGGDRRPDDADRPGPDAGADELAADIAETRQRLNETVWALSEKMDVKGRAKHAAGEATSRVSSIAPDGQGRTRLLVVAAGLLTLAGAVGIPAVVARQRRRRSKRG